MGQLDPLNNKTRGHITVCHVVITAEKNTAGKADMGIWRGVVQIQTIREALTGKVTLEQGPREVVKTLKIPGDSLPGRRLASAKASRQEQL